jgi:hypothetical protein
MLIWDFFNNPTVPNKLKNRFGTSDTNGRVAALPHHYFLIPAVLCVPKLRSNSAHPEFTPDVSSLAFLSGAVLYQKLSLASTTEA